MEYENLMLFNILDIGCGSSPKGDVNIDLFFKSTTHRGLNNKPINTKLIPNLIKADAHYLPIRNEMFNTIHAYHILEHLSNPIQFLNELKRVSKRKIIIKIPKLTKRLDYYSECEHHIFTWSKSSLKNLLFLVFNDVKVYDSKRKYHLKLPFLEETFNFFVFWVMSILVNSSRNELIAICLK